MPTKNRYFPLGGGLDVTTPAVTVLPGRLLTCENFEPDFEGGYRRSLGYERFDGGPPPHAQNFIAFEVAPWIPESFPYTWEGIEYLNEQAWLGSFIPADHSKLYDPENSYLKYLYDPDSARKRPPTRLMVLRSVGNEQELGLCHLAGLVENNDKNEALLTEVVKSKTYRMGVFRVTGDLKVGFVLGGRWEIVTEPSTRGLVRPETAEKWLLNVWRSLRNSIIQVPGAGHVRGAWFNGKKVYAFREDQREKNLGVYEVTPVRERNTYLQELLYRLDGERGRTGAGTLVNAERSTMIFMNGEGDKFLTTDQLTRDQMLSVQTIAFHTRALTAHLVDSVDTGEFFSKMDIGDSVVIKPDSGNVRFLGSRFEFVLTSVPLKTTAFEWRVEVGLIDFVWEEGTEIPDNSGDGPPNKITVRFAATTDTSITFSWRAPTSGPAPTSYEYRFRRPDRQLAYPTPYGTTTDTSVTFSGLDPGGEYYMQVRAQNAAGEGPWSEFLAVRAQNTRLDANWLVNLELSIFGKVGWTPVNEDRFNKVVRFRAGTASTGIPWKEGTEITATTPSGTVILQFSATIHRVVDWAGGYADNNARGFLVLRNVEGANAIFDGYKLLVGGNSVATMKGTPVDFNLSGGSFLRFEQHNFYAGADTQRIYACNADLLFEIDEDGYFSQILIPTVQDITGNNDDTDELDLGRFITLAAHGELLAVSVEGGKLLGSSTLRPMNFSSVVSAFEFGLGNEIVGVQSIVGEVLVVATERGVKGLFGNASEGFELRNISERQGSLPNSVRKLDDVYSLSWQGVNGLTRTDQFGDFASDTVSNAVEPVLKSLLADFTTASVVKSANQYRLHFVRNQTHYEFGRFQLNPDRSKVDSTTEEGSKLVKLDVFTVDENNDGNKEQISRLTLPWKKSFRWLEAAAGGDFFNNSYNRDPDVTNSDELVTYRSWADKDKSIGATAVTVIPDKLFIAYDDRWDRFFNRADRMEDKAWEGSIIRLYQNDSLVTTFFVTEALPDNEITTVSSASQKGFRGVQQQSLSPSDLPNSPWRMEFTVPPAIEEGKGAVLAVRYRGVEHTYIVDRFCSGTGKDPDNDRSDCFVFLKPLSPDEDKPNFLDGSQDLYEFELAVSTEGNALTETMVMYVPETVSADAERGTQHREKVMFGRTAYPTEIEQAWECPTPISERIFFTGTDGFLYEDRVGTTYDGEPISAFLRTTFVHLGTPNTRKRFRQCDLEVSSKYETNFHVVMDLDFAGPDISELTRNDREIAGKLTYWNSPDAEWGSFYWDGSLVSHASIDLQGSGVNASFLFIVEGAAIENLIIQGLMLHYSPRRIARSGK